MNFVIYTPVAWPVNGITNCHHFKMGIPGKDFNLISPFLLPCKYNILEKKYTQRIKLWNTSKLGDKYKTSWYWNQCWVLAKEIPYSRFQYSCLIILHQEPSFTYSDILFHSKPLGFLIMFPRYCSVPRPSSKRKCFLQILERANCPSMERPYEGVPL